MITQTTREPLYQECLQCGHEYSTAVGNLCPNDNSELVPVFSDSMEGITINEKYKIHSLCGSGAHGNVYRARHLALSKDVAIKFLHPHLIDNAAKLHRFENEARALSELSHPNIVKVIDFGLQPQPYIVMDYAAGKRLDQILEMVGSFPLKIAINVFLQICEGMAEVHAHGMIHQDLKPSNILVSKIETDAPEVKILDFGTAKLVVTDSEKTGEFVGSPPYMSPEQCGGEPTDARSDIYSLGCLMYEILTGQKPFKASTVEDYFFKHLNQLPEPPSRVAANIKIPEELDRIICRTLSKQVDFRVQSMEELANALKAVSTETMALTKSAVQDQAAMPGLPLIWPGLGAVSAVSLLTSLRTPAVPAELAHSPYLTYVIGLLSLFAVVYWVLAVLKLHKFAAAKKQCPEPTRGVAFFLFCNSLPVTPLIATAAMLCGTIMGGGLAASLAGWTLYLSYATFAFVCTFRYYTSLAGLTKDKTEITSDERRRIWLGVLLTFLLQCPAVTATLLGRYMDLELGMVLTCWAMGYVVLLVLKSEMERVFNRKTTKNSIGLILTLAFPFIVMCNGLLAWTISSVSNFTRQIATAPTAQLYFERGSWHRSATHYQLALNDYNKAAALAPADFWNLRRRGQVLNAMERHGEAIECFSKAIVQNKADQNILIDRGNAYGENHQLAQAIADYLESARLSRIARDRSTESIALGNAAVDYYKNGEYEKAIESTKAASQTGEYDHSQFLNYYVAKSLLEQGNYDEALRVSRLLASGSEGFFKNIEPCITSMIYSSMGDYSAALDALKPVSEKWTDWWPVHQARAVAYLGMKKLDEALVEARKAAESGQDDLETVECYTILARVYLARKDYAEALRQCDIALRISTMKETANLRNLVVKEQELSKKKRNG